jgi:hypothetical protein
MDDALITALSAFGGLLILAFAAEHGGRLFRGVLATIVAAISLAVLAGYLHLASLHRSTAVAPASAAPQAGAAPHSTPTGAESRSGSMAQTETVPRVEAVARTDILPRTACIREGTVPACSCVARP